MKNGLPPGMIEEPLPNDPEREEEDKGRIAQRGRIIRAILSCNSKFWRDRSGRGYVTLTLDGKTRRLALRSGEFRTIARIIYGAINPSCIGDIEIPGAFSDTAWNEALPSLEAVALRGPVLEPAIRRCWGPEKKTIVIDIGDDDWRAIEVTLDGWRVIPETFQPLIRTDVMRPMPLPEPVAPEEKGVVIGEMQRLLNVGGPEFIDILFAWMVAALWPEGPYGGLLFTGEAESGKSTIQGFLKSVVDPAEADLIRPPKESEGLFVAAASGIVLSLENLSRLDPEMSDNICSLLTGRTGIARRRLYTDGDIALKAASCTALMNGIDDSVINRPDLETRFLRIFCPPLRPEAKIADDEHCERLERLRPKVLGLVLDALVLALRHARDIRLINPPRIALLTKCGMAGAPAWGSTAERVEAAIRTNRAAAAAAQVEADPLGKAIGAVLGQGVEWRGSASDLLRAVNEIVPAERRPKGWPIDATRLGARLRRLAPALRASGIDIDTERAPSRARERLFVLRRKGEDKSDLASAASAASETKENQCVTSDAGFFTASAVSDQRPKPNGGGLEPQEGKLRTLASATPAQRPISVRNFEGDKCLELNGFSPPSDAADAADADLGLSSPSHRPSRPAVPPGWIQGVIE